jgi:hypothetical protein
MKTSSALTQMYKIFVEKEGPVLAKETLMSVLYIAIADLEKEGLDVSDSLLNKKLDEELKNILKASKTDVA